MASDIAQTPQLTNGDAPDHPYHAALDSHREQAKEDSSSSSTPSAAQAVGSAAAPPPLTSKLPSEPSPALVNIASATSVPIPSDLNPIENVASGIQPVASLLSKDGPNLSHPTPPREEPPTVMESNVDVEMSGVLDDSAPVSAPQPPVVEPSIPEPPAAIPSDSTPVAPSETPTAALLSETTLALSSQPTSQVQSAAVSVSPPEPVPSPLEPAASTPQPLPTLPSAPSESSLVRPREDDEDDEPAAKRSRVDEAPQVDVQPSPPTIPEPPSIATDTPASFAAVEPTIEATAEPVSEPVPDPMAISPSAEVATKVESLAVEPKVETPPVPAVSQEVAQEIPVDVKGEPAAIVAPPQPEGDEITVTPSAASHTQPQFSVQPPTVPAAADAAPATVPTPAPAAAAGPAPPLTVSTATEYDNRPMTSVQKSTLSEKMKNLKKTKNSIAFLRPVDPVALNIPNYLDVIKTPMDLGTMEQKLKDGQYASVQDFANDFHLIVANTRRFNGDAHPVSIAGMSMEAYFRRMMETVPSADTPAPPPKSTKKRSPSVPRENRRESRNAALVAAAAVAPAASAPATAASPTTTYALNSDGIPQLRRDSSNRPQRAIKPPQNREITYAKPKRKEHQLELRFCEYVLDEVRSPKYGALNHVFLQPVDPVALNIPHYRQVIKHPMDLATMSGKLKGGQYATASEFKKDFDLMIKNCLAFNPMGNPVHDIGVQFQREFDMLWADKVKWERVNQPASNRASSASVEEESADEEEEYDDDEDEKSATIRALKQQLAAMQSALSGLEGSKPAKPKKQKTGKSSSKKSSSSAPIKTKSAPKTSKPKKPRQVTYDEKQEISEAVGNMSELQVGKLTQIITSNCEKYRDMDEMELEIDDLPNDVQLKLLDYVRSIFGRPKKQAREPSPDDAAAMDDDDFEPERRARGGGGKRKKHKPMGKKEQTDTIRSLQDKLAQFSGAGTSGSESPTNSSFRHANAPAESSGDEDSEESEEE